MKGFVFIKKGSVTTGTLKRGVSCRAEKAAEVDMTGELIFMYF